MIRLALVPMKTLSHRPGFCAGFALLASSDLLRLNCREKQLFRFGRGFSSVLFTSLLAISKLVIGAGVCQVQSCLAPEAS